MRRAISRLWVAIIAATPSAPSNAPPSDYYLFCGRLIEPYKRPTLAVEAFRGVGRDDQVARLQGRLVSFEGDERYTFEDATGRITVEIDNEDFPAGQSISAEQKVELTGEFDKGLRKTEFEVDRLTLVP